MQGPGERVHLALYGNQASGDEQALTNPPVFEEKWQNDVAAAIVATARRLLAEERPRERVLALAIRAMAAVSGVSNGFLERAPAGSVACKASCSHCCHQAVAVTVPEALAIFEHLKRTRSNDELAILATRAAEYHDRARGLSTEERFSPEHPCVFLENSSCSVYEVRPLVCRGLNSLDADECERRLKDPEARAAFVASGSGGRAYLGPIRAFQSVSAGLKFAIAKLYGLDARPVDLLAAIRLLLSGPKSLVEAWLRGEAAFEQARPSSFSGAGKRADDSEQPFG
jgi:Fe-S-cluster containining protein